MTLYRTIAAHLRLALLSASLVAGVCAPSARGEDPSPAGGDAAARFAAGCAAYDRRDYAAARDGFLALAGAGFIDPALYFNLGNSCYRMGELAQAVLWYERARRLAPGDPDIRTNLRIAMEDLGLIDAERERQLAAQATPLTLFRAWLRSRRLDQWRTLALAAYWASALLALPALLYRRARPWLRWPAAGTLLLLLLGAIGWAGASADLGGPPRAIVLDQAVPARYAPIDDARVRFELRAGETIRIIERAGGWLRVRRPGASEEIAYIPSAAAELIYSPTP